MKKIFKLLNVLIAISILLCLSGCDLGGLVGGDNTAPEEALQYQKADGEPIEHEFYLSDDKTSYIYYTSTQRFVYGNHDDCIYQISFKPTKSDASEGTWKLYTRERGSTKIIDLIYEGTFKGVNGGSIRNGGTVNILIENEIIDTLTIEERPVYLSSGVVRKTACYVNVAASHKIIGATDAK